MVSLKTDLIIAFQRVVELKTVHAAAKDLGLTQAAITKRLRALEGQIGVSLFLRSRRGMALTDEGKALLNYCKTIDDAEGTLLAQLHGENRQEVTVTITGPTSFISNRLPSCCETLYKKYPFLRLHFRSDDHSNLVEVLRRGQADLAIVARSQVPNELSSKVLKPDRYLLVASSDWKNRPLSEILENERIIDFYEKDSTTTDYLRKFDLQNRVGKSRLFINENEALIRYFILGIGFGTLTETVAKPFIDAGQLVRLNRGQVYEDELALVWFERSKSMDYFLDLVKAVK